MLSANAAGDSSPQQAGEEHGSKCPCSFSLSYQIIIAISDEFIGLVLHEQETEGNAVAENQIIQVCQFSLQRRDESLGRWHRLCVPVLKEGDVLRQNHPDRQADRCPQGGFRF